MSFVSMSKDGAYTPHFPFFMNTTAVYYAFLPGKSKRFHTEASSMSFFHLCSVFRIRLPQSASLTAPSRGSLSHSTAFMNQRHFSILPLQFHHLADTIRLPLEGGGTAQP